MNIINKKSILFILVSIFICTIILTKSFWIKAHKNTLNNNDSTPNLTVYSGHSETLTNYYIKEFTEKTHLNIDVIQGNTQDLHDIIKNKKVDVIIGVASDTLQEYHNDFLDYSPDYIKDITDEDNHFSKHWIGDARIPMVIIYNKQLLSKDDLPEKWTDLLQSRFKGQVAMADPTTSGSSYTQLVTLLTVFGKEDTAWNYIENLIKQTGGHLFERGKDITPAVSRGEYTVGITLESFAYEQKQENKNIGFIFPKEGTTARTSGISILKSSYHLDNAKLFVDFILSRDTQQAVANSFYRRPTHNKVQLPEKLPPLSQFKIIDYDYTWAVKHKHDNLIRWKEIHTKIMEENND